MPRPPSLRPAAPTSTPPASWLARSIRTIAALEVLKGIAALALAWGLIDALRHNELQEWAVALAGRLHVAAGSSWPTLILDDAQRLQTIHIGEIGWLAAAYALMRFGEGFGLWFERRWAEWLSALSTGLYLPFEIAHLLHKPGAIAVVVVVINLIVLAVMIGRLRLRSLRHERAPISANA